MKASERNTSQRTRLFRVLTQSAAACRTCERLADKRAVLGPSNGSLSPKVLFIGEAPGRRGADRTRRPFTGDQSSLRFDELLASINLSRDDIFITNAVLCCPADEQRNHSPTAAEISNCSSYLRSTIELIESRVVATLGAVALRAVGKLFDRAFKLAEVAGKPQQLERFTLLPLYHTSPRVLNTVRSLKRQKQDFRRLRRLIDNES